MSFDMLCTYQSRRYSDASFQENGLEGWQQAYTQIGRGAFDGAITRLDLDGVSLIEERLNVAVGQETCPPEEKILLIFSETQPRRIDGVVSAHQCLVHVGGNEIQLVTGSECRSFVVSVDVGSLPDSDGRKLPPIWAVKGSDEIAATARWIESVLNAAPDLIMNSADDIPVLSAIIRDKVADVCGNFLLTDERHGFDQTDSSRLVRRAKALADELFFEPLTVGWLTRELDVADHVLRAAFLQCTGVSTYAWLRQRRLKRARGQILDARHDGRTIADIAMENGFFHLGRFAAYYAETYGEAPSKTMRL